MIWSCVSERVVATRAKQGRPLLVRYENDHGIRLLVVSPIDANGADKRGATPFDL